MKVGNKVRIRADGAIPSSLYGAEGTIESLGSVTAQVSFIIPFSIYYGLPSPWSTGSWYNTDHSLVLTSWTLMLDTLEKVRQLTSEEESEFQKLKEKKNRSPVEEYILSGLEN
jgi:hypothetical protein